jgi:ubiquinone/menaquinone biosynthesis C-methylase UbiE
LADNAANGDEDIRRLVTEYDRRRQDRSCRLKYSPFNASHLFALQSRQRHLLELLSNSGFEELKDISTLEVGSGSGSVLREFLSIGCDPRKMYGVELLPHRCADAKKQLPWANVIRADGRRLPVPDDHFDLVMQFTMFTSILDADVRQTVAAEMMRVLKPGGVIIWYDFWLNPINSQTKGIKKKEICKLFPNSTIKTKKITLAPPIARKLIKVSRILCEIIESICILNTHYLVIISTPEKM